MLCPNCESPNVRITNTRTNLEHHYKQRRRECKDCGARWTTIERIAGKVQLRKRVEDA
ncbi:hypothetical protein [Brevibacillus marinus]|uniref:NrdR family transcriptional regulator n=1 Tax=Brevibacillus marinus TaxID=2496837 RepID=UPI003B9760A5